MSREINQETRFSDLPQEAHKASFAGRHLNAEAFVNPERELASAEILAHNASVAQPATPRGLHILQPAEDGRGLRSNALSGLLAGFMLFLWYSIIVPGVVGATIGAIAGFAFSGGNPIAAAIGAAIGGVMGLLFRFVTRW